MVVDGGWVKVSSDSFPELVEKDEKKRDLCLQGKSSSEKERKSSQDKSFVDVITKAVLSPLPKFFAGFFFFREIEQNFKREPVWLPLI